MPLSGLEILAAKLRRPSNESPRHPDPGSWPDGHVCRTCLDRAVQARGTCPGCGQERALPGLRPGDGALICTDCAGFSQSFLAMDSPLSGLTWLYRRRNRAGSASDLLQRLARGEAELTHEGLMALQPWRAGCPPSRPPDGLRGFSPPSTGRSAGSSGGWPPTLRASPTSATPRYVRRFATWDVLPRLPRSGGEEAGQHGRPPPRRRPGQARHRLSPVAVRPQPHPARLPAGRRRRLARRGQPACPPRHPEASPLLYAQPASRIVRLTLDDVIRTGGEVLRRARRPADPVPEPVAGLWPPRPPRPSAATHPETTHARHQAADQAPVNLGDAITGIDECNLRILIRAVLHAAGRRQFP